MHRQPFLNLLNEYTTDIEDEKKMFVQFREFVELEPDCVERTLAKGHITASVWIVNQSMDKTLLTHHVKINKWLQPGGHCDGETDVPQSALRELEESNDLKWFYLTEVREANPSRSLARMVEKTKLAKENKKILI